MASRRSDCRQQTADKRGPSISLCEQQLPALLPIFGALARPVRKPSRGEPLNTSGKEAAMVTTRTRSSARRGSGLRSQAHPEMPVEGH